VRGKDGSYAVAGARVVARAKREEQKTLDETMRQVSRMKDGGGRKEQPHSSDACVRGL
jgi:ribosomal protein L44E